MKIQELSDNLIKVSAIIKQYGDKFTDKKTIDEADKFIKALARFEKTLETIITGENPSLNELKLLIQEKMKQHSNSFDDLGDFSKKILGKKTALGKRMSFDEYVDKVTFEIVKKGKSEFAISLLKRLEEANSVDFKSLDREAILLEVRRLGSLCDEDLEIEKQILLKDKERLFLLAKTAGVIFKPSSRSDTVFKKLITLGRRFYENTGITNLNLFKDTH